MSKKFDAKTIAGVGVLTAIVVVLQLLGSFIHFGPFAITLVLAPIIIGAALYGAWAGGWLGFVFGFVVLLTDAGAFLAVSVPGTIVTCILKGILAGVCAALVYKALEKVNRTLAVIIAGIVAPVVNTGVFLLGCLVFFLPTIKEWGAAAGYESVGSYFLFGFVGLNFVVELAINLVLSAVIVRIIQIALRNSANNK